MRKSILFIICSVVAVAFSGCSPTVESASVKNAEYPKSISFDDYDSLRDIKEENKLDESYKQALNKFSYSSASKILSMQTKNISYSPTSLYMTLSLAGIGAKGETRNEIFTALSLSDKDSKYLSEQNRRLFRLLYSDNDKAKLKIANSLWMQKNTSFKSSFIDNAVKNFYASIYSVDFSDSITAGLMSRWISDNTKGTLSPEIDIDNEQIMSILNTIYFKDEWIDKFNEQETKPDTFYLSNGDKISCDFMNSKYSSYGFVKGNGFTSSSLPLKNSGSMMFILPDRGVSIDDLISTPEKAASIFDEKDAKRGKVIFKIPKFSFGSSLDLNNMLKTMGIKSAFEENANFTEITDHTAFISNIKQQTHLAIDEKGIEAAAFTKIDYVGSAPAKDEIAEMILDRPFIFVIKADSDTILFIGVINNPTQK